MIHTETEMQMIATKYYVTNVNAYKKGTLLEKNVPFYNIKYILHIAKHYFDTKRTVDTNKQVCCVCFNLSPHYKVHKTQRTKITY